jgi:putative copper export protein
MANQEKKAKKRFPIWAIILIALLIVIGLVVFIGTFGKVNIGKSMAPEDFRESKSNALLRYERYQAVLNKRLDLKKKLDRIHKYIYLSVRVIFVLVWAGLIFFGYTINYINDLEDILNYSEALLLIILVFNFLCFGSLTNMNRMLDSLRTIVKNRVYRKYINLEEIIQRNESELAVLRTDIQDQGLNLEHP